MPASFFASPMVTLEHLFYSA